MDELEKLAYQMIELEKHQITSFHIFRLPSHADEKTGDQLRVSDSNAHENTRSFNPSLTMADLVFEPDQDLSLPSEQLDRNTVSSVPCWVPSPLRPGLLARPNKTQPIWETTQRKIAVDFNRPIHDLLNGKNPSLCTVSQLTEEVLSFLEQAACYLDDIEEDKQCRYRLGLSLTEKAQERIIQSTDNGAELLKRFMIKDPVTEKDIPVIPIKINDCFIFEFTTGRLVTQLSLQANIRKNSVFPLVILNEINDSVSRFSDLVWIKHPARSARIKNVNIKPQLEPCSNFTIGNLVARLVFGSSAATQNTFRTFTHCYAQISKNGPEYPEHELEAFGTSLARQYTSDYAISPSAKLCEKVSDFKNVMHFVCREGASTVVDTRTNNKVIETLENYGKTSLQEKYLPIIILNIHLLAEFNWLNAKHVLQTKIPLETENNALSDEQFDKTAAQWRNLSNQHDVVKARYRFHQVSQVSMHNRFNSAFRSAFDLSGLETQLSDDLKSMAANMQTILSLRNEQRQRLTDRKYQWFTLAIEASVITVAVAQLFSMIHDFAAEGMSIWEQFGILGVFVSFAIAICLHHNRNQS